MAEEWKHDFQAFADDVGEPPSPMHSLGQINSARGWFPGNVRWMDKRWLRARQLNRLGWSRGPLKIEGMTIAEWSERSGVPANVIGARLHAGWAFEDAIRPGSIS